MMIAGGVLVLGAVLYLLEVANGPGSGPTTFAERRSYDLVKRDLHAALPIGAPIALAGLGIAIWGNRIRERASQGEGGVG